MENKIYNWLVDSGNLLFYRENDNIFFQVDGDNQAVALLNQNDVLQLCQILKEIAFSIWKDETYEKKPYQNQLAVKNENGYEWDINGKLLLVNQTNNGLIKIEILHDKSVNLEVNVVVEFVQILSILLDF